MNASIITKHFFIVYAVHSPTNEYRSIPKAYFSSEAEAIIASKHIKGWYSNQGTVKREEHDATKFGEMVYDTALEWAKANLTYDEVQKNWL